MVLYCAGRVCNDTDQCNLDMIKAPGLVSPNTDAKGAADRSHKVNVGPHSIAGASKYIDIVLS